ncbi:MAG: hypothetical protein JSV84_10435 [Gemmatimonadota bacterium]|nr:MAG: hypothetical protein JSV84_10435 [Gemmatimonadota bacterium]
MMNVHHKICVAFLCTWFWLIFCALSQGHSDPLFVSRADTTGCEGKWLIFSIYADALFPDDELEFDMESAPEGALLENLGKCG